MKHYIIISGTVGILVEAKDKDGLRDKIIASGLNNVSSFELSEIKDYRGKQIMLAEVEKDWNYGFLTAEQFAERLEEVNKEFPI